MEPVMRPEDPPVLGMPRACSVRRWLGEAAAHLLSAAVSVGGSRVEKLGRHCWSEAARGLMACQTDFYESCKLRAQRRDSPGGIASAKAEQCRVRWTIARA